MQETYEDPDRDFERNAPGGIRGGNMLEPESYELADDVHHHNGERCAFCDYLDALEALASEEDGAA